MRLWESRSFRSFAWLPEFRRGEGVTYLVSFTRRARMRGLPPNQPINSTRVSRRVIPAWQARMRELELEATAEERGLELDDDLL